jgi:hypothetical protein
LVYARDNDCSQGVKTALVQAIVCGNYKGKTLQQIIDLGITLDQLINAGCTLCDFVPTGSKYYQNVLLNPDFEVDGTSWTTLGGTVNYTGSYVELSNSGSIRQDYALIPSGDKRIVLKISELIGSMVITIDRMGPSSQFTVSSKGITFIDITSVTNITGIQVSVGSGEFAKLDFIYLENSIEC